MRRSQLYDGLPAMLSTGLWEDISTSAATFEQLQAKLLQQQQQQQ
jgi:hypothetical protein